MIGETDTSMRGAGRHLLPVRCVRAISQAHITKPTDTHVVHMLIIVDTGRHRRDARLVDTVRRRKAVLVTGIRGGRQTHIFEGIA